MEENQNEKSKNITGKGFFFKTEWYIFLSKELDDFSYVRAEIMQSIIETGIGGRVQIKSPDGKVKHTTPLMCCIDEHHSELNQRTRNFLKKLNEEIKEYFK